MPRLFSLGPMDNGDDDDDESTDDDLGIMAANRAGSKRPVEVISLDDD
jgi:hypothetical protein